ncbi:hypothetical protein [Pseudidiomarina aquimaris]|uniref:hypothetical protein n=1 Tax=Pseudidiomarina aquimaris TaxID=641841 RepID=UPI003A9703D8
MARTITVPQPPQLDAPLDMATLGAFVRYKRSTLGITLENAAALRGLSKQAAHVVQRCAAIREQAAQLEEVARSAF